MSLQFMDSFDHYSEESGDATKQELDDKYDSIDRTTCDIVTTGRTANCWSATGSDAHLTNNYTSINDNQYLGCSMAINDVGSAVPFLEVLFTAVGSGAAQTYTLEAKAGGGITIKQTVGLTGSFDATTYEDGTSIPALNANGWHYIEACFIHHTTQNVLGYQIRINDKFVAAANDTATADPAVSSSNYIKIKASSAATLMKVDDLIQYNGRGMDPGSNGAVNVDWLGSVAITALLPIDAVATESTLEEWPNLSSGTDRYALVDDAYDDASTVKDAGYIEGTASGQRERLSITDLAVLGGEILAGQVTARLKNAGTAGNLNVQALTDTGGVDQTIASTVDIGSQTSAFKYFTWTEKAGAGGFVADPATFNAQTYGLKIV